MTEPCIPLREELHALPEIPLPDALWQRVDSGRRRKLRRRKLGAGIAALALVAVMATPLLAPLLTVDDAIRGEQSIASRSADGVHDIQADLRALDRALQAAYDRGASDDEIAPMWVARSALVNSRRTRSVIPTSNRI